MDEAKLWRLADVGIAALPPGDLGGLIQWCWDQCEIRGDARYCVIARTLEPIAALFDEADEYGGVDFDFHMIDAELHRRLPAVLEEDDPETASLLARSLREEVWRILVSGS